MTKGNMKVVVVDPGKEAKIMEIANTLEDMQETVGGLIEEIHAFDDDAVIICNEEGKIRGLTPNRLIRDANGKPSDIICGTFFICYAPFESESFESLSDELCEKYKEMFKTPEMFVKTEKGIAVVPMK